MANEHRISSRYWTGDRRGWNDREKLLGLYLLTCTHRNTEGLYLLPRGYITVDLGWTTPNVVAALATVVASGLAAYDETAEVMMLPNALKRQRPTTERQIQGAVSRLQAVPDTWLWEPFLASCRKYAPNLAQAIDVGIPPRPPCADDGHSNAHGNAHCYGHTDAHTDEHANAPLARVPRSSQSQSLSQSLNPPSPPVGGRARSRVEWRKDIERWAATHFEALPPERRLYAVEQAVGKAGARTLDDVRDHIDRYFPHLASEVA